jgi:hypothetical protein
MGVKKQKGKGGRKYGRTTKKPSHIRYNNENRREVNKARKRHKQEKKEAKRLEKKNNINISHHILSGEV